MQSFESQTARNNNESELSPINFGRSPQEVWESQNLRRSQFKRAQIKRDESPFDRSDPSTFHKNHDNSLLTAMEGYGYKDLELVQIVMMDPSFQLQERFSPFKDMKIFDQMERIEGENTINTLAKGYSRIPSNRANSRFFALKIKDYGDKEKELNCLKISQKQKKSRSHARAKTVGVHKTKPLQQEVVPARVNNSPPEDERAIWQICQEPYEGVFALEKTKQKADFFINLQRYTKKNSVASNFNSNLVQTFKPSPKPSSPKVRKKQPQEMRRKAQPICQKNEDVMAVFQGMADRIPDQALDSKPNSEQIQVQYIQSMLSERNKNKVSTQLLPSSPKRITNLNSTQTHSQLVKPRLSYSANTYSRPDASKLASTNQLVQNKTKTMQNQLQKNPDITVTFQKNGTEVNQTAACAKLMSISSDMRKNILPSMHEKINSIYKRRLRKYLNLVAIHGDRNQQVVNSIFNGKKLDEEQLRQLQNEVTLSRLKQKRAISASNKYMQSTMLSNLVSLQDYLIDNRKGEHKNQKEVLPITMFSLQHDQGENLKSEPHLPAHVNNANSPSISLPMEGLTSLMNIALSAAQSVEPSKKLKPPVIKQAISDPIQRIIYKAGITSDVLLKSKPNDVINSFPVKRPFVKELVMPIPSCQNEDLSKLISTNRIEDSQNSYESPHDVTRLILNDQRASFDNGIDTKRTAIEIDNQSANNPTEHTNHGSQSQLKLKPMGVNSQEQIQNLQLLSPFTVDNMFYTDRQKFQTNKLQINLSSDIDHLMQIKQQLLKMESIQPKTVKTYEFHLPMHYIQEEGTKNTNNVPRGLLSNGKRTTGLMNKAKDDISSQMIDDATYLDLQNSVQHLQQSDIRNKEYSSRFKNQIGNSNRSQKFFQSQTAIIQTEPRGNEVHHSIEMKTMQMATSMAQTSGKVLSIKPSFDLYSNPANQFLSFQPQIDFAEGMINPVRSRKLVVLTGSGEIKCTPDVQFLRDRKSAKMIEPEFFQYAQKNFELYSKRLLNSQIPRTVNNTVMTKNANTPLANDKSSLLGKFSNQPSKKERQIRDKMETPLNSEKKTFTENGEEVINIASGMQTDPTKDDELEIFRFQVETTHNSKDSIDISKCDLVNPYRQKQLVPMKQHKIDLQQTKRKEVTPKSTKINKMFKQPNFKKSQQFLPKKPQNQVLNCREQHEQIMLQQGTLKTFKANGELFFRFEDASKTVGNRIHQEVVDQILKQMDLTAIPSSIVTLPLGSGNVAISTQNSLTTTLRAKTPWSNQEVLASCMINNSDDFSFQMNSKQEIQMPATARFVKVNTEFKPKTEMQETGNTQLQSKVTLQNSSSNLNLAIEKPPIEVPLVSQQFKTFENVAQMKGIASFEIPDFQNGLKTVDAESMQVNGCSQKFLRNMTSNSQNDTRRVISLCKSKQQYNTNISGDQNSPKAIYENNLSSSSGSQFVSHSNRPSVFEDIDVTKPEQRSRRKLSKNESKSRIETVKSELQFQEDEQFQIKELSRDKSDFQKDSRTQMDRSNFEQIKKASDLSPQQNAENRSARKKNNITILRDLQMKRAISIDKTILAPRKSENIQQVSNKVKLINQDMSQLIEAFFFNSNESAKDGILNNVMMFDNAQNLDARRRKIQSQQNARARRVIQTFDKPQFQKTNQRKSNGIFIYQQPTRDSALQGQLPHPPPNQTYNQEVSFNVNKFDISVPLQVSPIKSVLNTQNQNTPEVTIVPKQHPPIVHTNHTSNTEMQLTKGPSILTMGLDHTMPEQRRLRIQQQKRRTEVQVASPKQTAQVSNKKPTQESINKTLQQILTQNKRSNPVTVQLPLPSYKRIQGDHGQNLTGLDRALTRINNTNNQHSSVQPENIFFKSFEQRIMPMEGREDFLSQTVETVAVPETQLKNIFHLHQINFTCTGDQEAIVLVNGTIMQPKERNQVLSSYRSNNLDEEQSKQEDFKDNRMINIQCNESDDIQKTPVRKKLCIDQEISSYTQNLDPFDKS